MHCNLIILWLKLTLHRYTISPKADIFSLDWQYLIDWYCRLAKSHPCAIGWQNLSTDTEKLSQGHRAVESSIPFHNRLKAFNLSLSCVGSPGAYDGHLLHHMSIRRKNSKLRRNRVPLWMLVTKLGEGTIIWRIHSSYVYPAKKFQISAKSRTFFEC